MECELKSKKMVAILQSRKDALESKLRDKTLELKKLCIQEAELTGILPPETPIEQGESPPVFRRRVGTSFTYPENLINKLKSKEEESLAKLELECKIQTSIAEAALGLANDGNASKSIRRKHRLMYQQSQRRLAELEARLTVLRQSIKSSNQLKQRKKPRPPLTELDCVDGAEACDEIDAHFKHSYNEEPSSLSTVNRDIMRNGHFYNSFGKSHNVAGYMHPNHQHLKSNWNRNQQYRRSVERARHNSGCYETENSNWLEDSNLWRNTAPVGYFSNQCYTTLPNESPTRMKSRYGSLDRRYRNSGTTDFEPHQRYSNSSRVSPSPPCPQRNSPIVHLEPNLRAPFVPSPDPSLLNAVLLPNQTYPENSLMRTQSLGNVEHSRTSLDTHSLQEKAQENFQSNTLGRKNREKEWRETSLDAECYERRSRTPPLHPRASKIPESPVPQRPYSCRSTRTPPPPPLPPPPHCSAPSTPPPPPIQCKSPVKSPPPLIESTVPFESPKNHTVVEVGKWQPYREVTKPFEMSDFYKYSTKFRKNAPSEKPEHHTLPQNRNVCKQLITENMPVLHRSNEDINRNNLNEAQFFDSKPLNNVTYRKHRPLTMMASDSNGNCAAIRTWHNDDS